MSLTLGDRLAHYDVTALIGEGGMGQVYQATDTKLNRQVALKILPEAFATDPDRLARFQREAQVLASLNHPNIAQIHGIEEQEGTRALVLELVEGPTLADRISKGPIPLDEALPIAKQIAEALEAAHEAGVIHRDLKPANIKVREDGTVKVLDFGLAKALDTSPTGDPSQSPTLTAAATQMGVIMGTAAYMSPEQARGKPVDKRADIWAFGVVLYEMLAGARPFRGEDVSLTLASVMKSDVDVKALPPDLPDPLRTVIHQCLQKDPTRRIRDIGDVRLAMDGAFDSFATQPSPGSAAPSLRWWQRPMAIVAALVFAAMLAVGLDRTLSVSPKGTGGVTRLTIPVPSDQRLSDRLSFVLSPDGRKLVYAATTDNVSRLYVRPLDEYDASPIAGTEGAISPFFSPDGEWVGFTAERQLRKVSLAGGLPLTIVPDGVRGYHGAAWGDDGSIVYTASLGSGLRRVSADGGAVEQLTRPDGANNGYAHVYPQFLPGQQSVLFTVWGAEFRGAAYSLASGEWHEVLPGAAAAVYLSNRRIAYDTVNDPDLLLVRPFDPELLAVSGPAVSLLVDAALDPAMSRHAFTVSSNGTLAYRLRSVRDLVWVDHAGRVESLNISVRRGTVIRLSPDGDRIAVRPADSDDLQVIDVERRTRTAIPQVPDTDGQFGALWSPDGADLTVNSNVGGNWDLYSVSADGRGELRSLLERPLDQFAAAWSADGRMLAYVEHNPETDADVWVLPVGGEPSPFLTSSFAERQPAFSPDGRSMAYVSDESGLDEVYVQAFPGGGGGSQTDGIDQRWARASVVARWAQVVLLQRRPVSSGRHYRRIHRRRCSIISWTLRSRVDRRDRV